MSKKPAILFFPGDFLADTQHLSLEEVGAYFLLLLHCNGHGGRIPKSTQKRQAIIKMTNKRRNAKWLTIWSSLEPFFVEVPDGYENPRMAQDIEKYNKKCEKMKKISYLGVEARRKRALDRACQLSNVATTTINPPVTKPNQTNITPYIPLRASLASPLESGSLRAQESASVAEPVVSDEVKQKVHEGLVAFSSELRHKEMLRPLPKETAELPISDAELAKIPDRTSDASERPKEKGNP